MIRSKPPTDKYREAWDKIWGDKSKRAERLKNRKRDKR